MAWTKHVQSIRCTAYRAFSSIQTLEKENQELKKLVENLRRERELLLSSRRGSNGANSELVAASPMNEKSKFIGAKVAECVIRICSGDDARLQAFGAAKDSTPLPSDAKNEEDLLAHRPTA